MLTLGRPPRRRSLGDRARERRRARRSAARERRCSASCSRSAACCCSPARRSARSSGDPATRSRHGLDARPPRAARREPRPASAAVACEPPPEPPVDVTQDYPDVVGARLRRSPTAPRTRPSSTTARGSDERRHAADPLRRSRRPSATTCCPTARCSGARSPASGPSAEATSAIAEALVQALANFGVDATVVGEISGPRVTRYELQLAPGTKVVEGRRS